MKPSHTVIDLFAGCGGMSLGFENAGYRLIAAVENWEPARSVYQRNFDHEALDLDLSTSTGVRALGSLKAAVIIGGPPCQDFSSALATDTDGRRADLTRVFCDIVIAKVPRAFVFENVPRARLSKVYENSKTRYRQAGYGLTEVILDAAYFGVPQYRKRLFLVGVKNSADGALKAPLEDKKSETPLTMREYFGSDLPIKSYFRVPTNYSRRGVFPTNMPCMTIRAVDRPIPKGYRPHPDDSTPIGDPTLRPLTLSERARVQTFPEDFLWLGSKTDLNTMIGNAVPVKLAEHVATTLLNHLNGKRPT